MPTDTYYDDPVLREMQDDMERAEAERPKKGWATVPAATQALVLAGMGLLAFFTWIGRMKPRTGTAGLVITAGIVLLMTRYPVSRTPLTLQELRMRLDQQLQMERLHPVGDIPWLAATDRYRLHFTGRRMYFQGRAIKHPYGVEVVHEDDTTDWYLAEQDVMYGHLEGWKEKPGGVWGDESRDLTFIPTPTMSALRWANQYLRRK